MVRFFCILILLVGLSGLAWGELKFPPPEFEGDFAVPGMSLSEDSAWWLGWVDVFVLLGALCVSAWLVLRSRSRRGMFWLSVFSLGYFGFYREGCICPIGAIQNTTQAVFDAGYFVPSTVILIFFLPLLFSLFFGRVFCAGVCPLGAMQDLVTLKPLQLPGWLNFPLRFFAYVYLGLAMLFAATGAGYVICRFDPFVPLFRMTGSWAMLTTGGVFLLIGVFVSRPYCRFLCPYGILLGWLSRFSWRHMSITPTVCTNCRLCEKSCPYGAINFPSSHQPRRSRTWRLNKAVTIFLIMPVVLGLGGWLGWELGEPLSRFHPRVELAELVLLDDGNEESVSDELLAFRISGEAKEAVFAEAGLIRRRFEIGSLLLGLFLSGVLLGQVVMLFLRSNWKEYHADQATCYSCLRCVPYCPE